MPVEMQDAATITQPVTISVHGGVISRLRYARISLHGAASPPV